MSESSMQHYRNKVVAVAVRQATKPRFNRNDIMEAHALLEIDYNVDGWLRERPSNQRRMESTSCQLLRLGLERRAYLGDARLTSNGRAIYRQLERRYGFTR